MKKTHFFSIAALCTLLAAGFTACSKDDDYIHGDGEMQMPANTVVMTLKDFVYEDATTRTTYKPSDKGLHTHWAKEDIVGVFPELGYQRGFFMTNSDGLKSAEFTGDKYMQVAEGKSVAYYPIIESTYLHKTEIPVSFPTTLNQAGNGSVTHLGCNDFMAAKGVMAKSGGVQFDFNHLGCLVELNLTMPSDNNIHEVFLSSESEWYTTGGRVDLTADELSIVPTSKGKLLTVKLDTNVCVSAGEALKVYFMMAPTSIGENQVKVRVKGYDGYLPSRTLEAGKVYPMHIGLQKIKSEDEYVDLGLSVLWATCNVGATSPEEYGDYFAWGETTPKNSYDWIENLTQGKHGPWDNGIVGNAQYDAATANWGAPWRMPTKAECDELVVKCDWTWTTQGGKNGWLIRGRDAYSGNAIFLPAAGYRKKTMQDFTGSYGNYWSASLRGDDTYCSYSLVFDSSSSYTNYAYRSYGQSVRPVRDK